MSGYTTKKQQIVVIASFIAAEGKIEELIETVVPLLAQLSREEGCISYEINRCLENPDKLTFVQKFISEAAIESHMQQPYSAATLEKVADGLTTHIEVETFHQIVL